MKKIKLLITLAAIFVNFSAMAAPIKTINFATEGMYPPFESVDETGQVKGFDIDVAKALCQQIKAECTFSTQTFSTLITSLQLGKYDAAIAAMNITPERQKQVSFTNAYYQPSGAFVAPIAKHYTLADINGKTVGVQQGSSFQQYLEAKYGKKITIKTYASAQDAFLDLTSGRVDVIIVDTPIAIAWVKKAANSQQFAMVDKPIVDPTYFGAGYGIAVNKNNTELLNTLNDALKQIKANGTYQKIVNQYFGTN